MQLKEEDRMIRILTGSYDTVAVAPGAFTELDLGCGKGSFSTALAERFPERRVFAADVMIGRLRKLVKRGERMKLENLTVFRTEAQLFVSRFLPDRSIDRLHLLCPDPWPKERHRGHRLVTSDFTAQLHRVLKTGGVFHFSSDDEPYRDSVERIFSTSPLFEPAPGALDDIADIKTDFERLWLAEGKTVRHYAYRALPPPPFAPTGH